MARKRDKCEFCLGRKGGVPGNENVLPGNVVACDFCTALWMKIKNAEREVITNVGKARA